MVKFSNWKMGDEQEKRRTGQGQVHPGFKLEAVRLVKGAGCARDGKDIGHASADAGKLGAALWERPTQGRWRQAGVASANGAGAPARGARHSGKSYGVLRQAFAVKYAGIAKHKALWPVSVACDVLGVSASGYFERWRRKVGDKPSKLGTTSASATKRCWFTSRPLMQKSKRSTAGPRCELPTGY